MGKDVANHIPHISENDLKNIQCPSAVDLNLPKQLQEKVFFDIQLNFVRRCGLMSLKKDAFMLSKDDRDMEYAEFRFHEKTKNNSYYNPNQARPRLYKLRNEICPIKSLKLYLSKISADSSTLIKSLGQRLRKFCQQLCTKSTDNANNQPLM